MAENSGSDDFGDGFGLTAIIGARGKMGGLYVKRCRAAGLEVMEINRPLTDEALEGLEKADQVMLSVPATSVEEVLIRIKDRMRPDAVLTDNVSVKVSPLRAMVRHHQGPVVGTHPLFGPNPPENDQRVAVTPGREEQDEQAALLVDAWLVKLGFSPFRTTAEEHDRAVALIQGLNFITTVAYLATLSREDQSILDFLTPSFHRRLDAAKKMITQDSELFSTLFEANPYSQDVVRLYRNYLHVAAGGDIEILSEQAKWWWRDNDVKSGANGYGLEE